MKFKVRKLHSVLHVHSLALDADCRCVSNLTVQAVLAVTQRSVAERQAPAAPAAIGKAKVEGDPLAIIGERGPKKEKFFHLVQVRLWPQPNGFRVWGNPKPRSRAEAGQVPPSGAGALSAAAKWEGPTRPQLARGSH